MGIDYQSMSPYAGVLLQAWWLSIYMTLISMAVGSALGIVVYLARASRFQALRGAAIAYVEVFRNTPLLVQLYLIFFGLPELGVNIPAVPSAIIAMTLNNAAYMAEIYRGGFEAIPVGQHEAGSALGLSRSRIFLDILLTPATRSVLPAATNQFIMLFLASSVASIIGTPELLHVVLDINNDTYQTFTVFSIAGALYLGTSGLLALVSRLTERHAFPWVVTSSE